MTQELEQNQTELTRALNLADKALGALRRSVALSTLANAKNYKERHEAVQAALAEYKLRTAELEASARVYVDEFDWNWQIESGAQDG